MNYVQLRQQIANRLDQRSDLDQVIQDFVSDRVTYWQNYFFFSSFVTDTSIVTTAGQYLYTLPNGIRNVRKMRMLIPGNNQAFTSLTSTITLPQATIAVGTTLGFTQTGGTLMIGGSQTVQYSGVTALSFTGCTGGTGTILSGGGVTQVSPTTTTTSTLTFPVGTVPVVSTKGFLPAGIISVGSTQVPYTSVDSTDFLGCTGGIGTQNSGSLVQQLYGIWLVLDEINYLDILELDPLAPSLQAQPSRWAPFGTQFRLYPTPPQAYPIEITGNAGPTAPSADTDDNFWTEDASSLIINDVCGEIYAGYLHNAQRAQLYKIAAQREYRKLQKMTWDLGTGPRVVRGYL